MDIALVSRLQNRIKELERDRKCLHRDLDSKGLPADLLSNDPEQEIYDTIRVSVLYLCLLKSTYLLNGYIVLA